MKLEPAGFASTSFEAGRIDIATLPKIDRLLIVRLSAMGDVIHTLPAVQALREAFPQAFIGWLIEERWAELLCAPGAARRRETLVAVRQTSRRRRRRRRLPPQQPLTLPRQPASVFAA